MAGCKARACASDSTAPRITRMPLVRSSGSSSDRLIAVSLLDPDRLTSSRRADCCVTHDTATSELRELHSSLRHVLLLLAAEALLTANTNPWAVIKQSLHSQAMFISLAYCVCLRPASRLHKNVARI